MVTRQASECRRCEETIFWANTALGEQKTLDWYSEADAPFVIIGGYVRNVADMEEVPENAARYKPHECKGKAGKDVWRNR